MIDSAAGCQKASGSLQMKGWPTALFTKRPAFGKHKRQAGHNHSPHQTAMPLSIFLKNKTGRLHCTDGQRFSPSGGEAYSPEVNSRSSISAVTEESHMVGYQASVMPVRASKLSLPKR